MMQKRRGIYSSIIKEAEKIGIHYLDDFNKHIGEVIHTSVHARPIVRFLLQMTRA